MTFGSKSWDLNSSATGNSNSNNVESRFVKIVTLTTTMEQSFTEGEFVKMDVKSKISITSPELNGQWIMILNQFEFVDVDQDCWI